MSASAGWLRKRAPTINPDTTMTYTSKARFHGLDIFAYAISDGRDGTRDELSQDRWRVCIAEKMGHLEEGQLWFTAMNLPVLISSVVTLGRSRFLFWVTR